MSKAPEKSDPQRRFRRGVIRSALILTAFIGALIMAGAFGCADRLFYYPTRHRYGTPAEEKLTFEDVAFTSADGTPLTGWFIHAIGPPKGTIIHCHGNAQNMTSHWQFISFLPQNGYNVLVFDYRGYGQSGGKPSRRGAIDDACAAVDYVLRRPDVDPNRVAILGQSIGGAIACVVAAEKPALRGAVIDSAFTSYRSVAAYSLRRNFITYLLSWPLSRLLIAPGQDPIDAVPNIAPRPVLFIHGTADRIVPCDMSRQLFDRAAQPKELYIIDGAEHLGAPFTHAPQYQKRILEFLQTTLNSKSTGKDEPNTPTAP